MKSYLKFLSRNALYTIVEAVGLTLSLCFVILIGNYVWEQWQVTGENPNGNRVYAVGNEDYIALSWWDKESLGSQIPEVELAARLSGPDNSVITSDASGTKITATLTKADPEFFSIFPEYSLLEGSLEEYSIEGHCLVSESFARRLAGESESVIGKSCDIDGRKLMVCGVFRDFSGSLVPETDILENPQFDFYSALRPFSSIGSYMTFLLVKDGTPRQDLQAKVNALCKENYNYWSEDFKENFPIYTLSEVYFSPNQWTLRRSNLQMLKLLSIVVLLLLVCAVFNYVNLSLALSTRRSKEMATRRLLGATAGEIALKYILESVIFTAVCFTFALLLAQALLPAMNKLLLGASLSPEDIAYYIPLKLSWNIRSSAVYIAGVVLLGALSGFIPASFAAKFKPIDVVQGALRQKSKMSFSRVFIIFQNTVSLILIALSLLMEVQIRHMAERPLNARSDGLYDLAFLVHDYSDIEPLVDRLNSLPCVKRVAYGRGIPGDVNMGLGFTTDTEKGNADTQVLIGSEEYFDMLELHIIDDYGTPRNGSVWLSESLVAEINLTDSTRTFYANKFRVNGAESNYLGGIYADIPTSGAASPKLNLSSAFMVVPAEDILYGRGLLIEVQGDGKEAEMAIMDAYREWSVEKNGVYVDCSHGYIRNLLNSRLTPVRMTIRLVELFMLLSVLISLLGMVAMSTWYSDENAKSVAVRKVFGSDSFAETLRLTKSYLLMSLYAVIIGTPIGVWLSEKWLENYAYRVHGYWWVYVLAAVLTLLIAFVSVIAPVRRSALTNPADELKKE